MSSFYNNWNWIAWEKATFAAFLCSTGFMVFFSIAAVDHWIFPWNQISITAACLIPMFMVVIQHGPRWVRERSVSKEFIFIALLIIFGILNIFFGEELIPGRLCENDEEILDAVTRLSTSGLHATGTCRMGKDLTSVVDNHLRVRGVESLRVADCSVMPPLISGNTNGPAIAVGWRASDLILSAGTTQNS